MSVGSTSNVTFESFPPPTGIMKFVYFASLMFFKSFSMFNSSPIDFIFINSSSDISILFVYLSSPNPK